MAFRKENKIKNNFTKISIGLASPEEILENSSGEVLKPETINYRTYKPERDGLFCERIFGPVKNYECYCGKYKRIRYKGIVCDRCGVEVTEKKVRRERVGHIHLVVPVAHIWYFRTLPNKIGYLLGLPTKKLDSVIYYERYVVIQPGCVDSVAPLDLLLEEEYLQVVDNLPKENQMLDDADPNKFIAKIGAEAVYELLARLDLDELSYNLRHHATTDTSQQRKNEALKRLQVVESFRASKGRNRPEWMVVKVVRQSSSGDSARTASAGAVRWRSFCYFRSERFIPPRDHSQQPPQTIDRHQGARSHPAKRKTHVTGSRRFAVRQLPQIERRKD